MASSLIHVCQVVSVDDPTGGDRIKARMIPDDLSATNVDSIPWAFPLLPKTLYVKPKVNEAVLVLTANLSDGYSQRYYIGPINSQLDKLDGERYDTTALSNYRGSYYSKDQDPQSIPEANGAFPNNEDVSILGRGNSDIQLKEKDIRIRCGAKVKNSDGKTVFNKKDPAYIKLEYDNDAKTDTKGEEYKSTATIVADKINLIGNNSKDYIKTTDEKDLVTDDAMSQIMEKAHQLPYGDILVEFLNLFRTVFLTHTHPFATMPQFPTEEFKQLATYKLEDTLSDTVRIN